MAEEEELLEFENLTETHRPYSYDYEKLFTHDNFILLCMILAGLTINAVIIYTIAKSKRLRSRTHLIIMNWLIFDTIANEIIFPLVHYVRLHEYNFTLHLIIGNLLLLCVLTEVLFLHVLLTNSVMQSSESSFKKYLETFYAIVLSCYVFVMSWKIFTQFDIYMEFIILISYSITIVSLIIRVFYRQCHRIIKCHILNSNEELRLHFVTFFVVSKVVLLMCTIGGMIHKSMALVHVSRLGLLSGIYVIILMMVKDINFKISLFEILGLNVKKPNDVDTMINNEVTGGDGESEADLIETRIDN